MDRRRFLQGTSLLAAAGATHVRAEAVEPISVVSAREQWLALLQRTAGPVLNALSQRRLQQLMPVERKPGQEASRRQCTYLEALGRSLSGIAPWLESGGETALREHYCELAREAIAAGVDPASPDYMPFGAIAQTLVDAAFLGLGILRAPQQLADKLPAKVKAQLIDGLKKTRIIKPPVNNWRLFAAVVEATLERLGADWDHAPVELALASHKDWYLGDGVYGDGPHFHADYYDSFVIHPFLLAVLASPVG